LSRFGEGDLCLLFFCFLFFSGSESDDEEETDEFEVEREADDERVRFDCFLFFFVCLIGTTFDLEEVLSLVDGFLFFDCDCSLMELLFSFILWRFVLLRSTDEFDDGERVLGLVFVFFVGSGDALLAADEEEDERCCFSVFREDFIGLRLFEGDFAGERLRLSSLSLRFGAGRVGFLSIRLKEQ
jgi:hypothetical protein